MSMITYKRYCGVFDYDAEADIFHGEVMHLSDVITFQGRSIDELKEALKDSVEDYLESCAQKGKTPQKPYSGRFNVRLDPELHQRIALEAASSGKSLNGWVADALKTVVRHQHRS